LLKSDNAFGTPFNAFWLAAAQVANYRFFIIAQKDNFSRAYIHASPTPCALFMIHNHPASVVGNRILWASIFTFFTENAFFGLYMDAIGSVFVDDLYSRLFGIKDVFMRGRAGKLA